MSAAESRRARPYFLFCVSLSLNFRIFFRVNRVFRVLCRVPCFKLLCKKMRQITRDRIGTSKTTKTATKTTIYFLSFLCFNLPHDFRPVEHSSASFFLSVRKVCTRTSYHRYHLHANRNGAPKSTHKTHAPRYTGLPTARRALSLSLCDGCVRWPHLDGPSLHASMCSNFETSRNIVAKQIFTIHTCSL